MGDVINVAIRPGVAVGIRARGRNMFLPRPAAAAPPGTMWRPCLPDNGLSPGRAIRLSTRWRALSSGNTARSTASAATRSASLTRLRTVSLRASCAVQNLVGVFGSNFVGEQRSGVRHIDGLALPARNDQRSVPAEPRDDRGYRHGGHVGELAEADDLDHLRLLLHLRHRFSGAIGRRRPATGAGRDQLRAGAGGPVLPERPAASRAMASPG